MQDSRIPAEGHQTRGSRSHGNYIKLNHPNIVEGHKVL
jgi:hypothetical protein